jgi:hypothetical protein
LAIPDDVDSDILIARLAGPLAPDVREAFRRAAEDALARVPCLGEGSAYRALVTVQRAYFDPPDDHRASWDIAQDRVRPSKLISRPPIGYGRARDATRQRRLVG